MSTFTTKYLPLIVAILMTIGSATSTTIQNFWSAHAETAGILTSLMTAIALFLPQPHK